MLLSTIQKCYVSKTTNGGQSAQLYISAYTLIENITFTSNSLKEVTGVKKFPDEMIEWKGYGEYIKVYNP